MTLLLLVFACHGGGDKDVEGPTRDALSPFPNAWLLEDGYLAIPEGALPQAEDGTPLDVGRLRARTGFSPVQTSVIDLGVALDASLLPTQDEASAGEGAVQLWDLDDGTPIRAFAELDAWPEMGDEVPSLLVRPLQPMTPDHEVAVVLTEALKDADGEDVPSPDWYVAASEGEAGDHLEREAADTPALLDRLSDLGIDNPILAFSFPVDDGGELLDDLLEQVDLPDTWTWSEIADADAGDSLPAGTWKQLSGTFGVSSWIGPDGHFVIEDGRASYASEGEADLLIHIPDSVRDAAPGTVPVWLFGHGIFGNPGIYLSDPDDPSAVVEVADRAGAILIATSWTGLTRSDLATVLAVAQDFGRLPEVTDPLAQALANQEALVNLIQTGGLLDDPELLGLPDRSRLFYYGISLGGIEGAVLIAHDDRLEHAVLHAAGSTWSTMLERSNAWVAMEPSVVDAIPSPHDRQVLYAASQLFWDPVDPANVASELSDRSVLWQECLGDDLVPNLTTEIMTRGVGTTLLQPATTSPVGVPTAEGPLAGPALFQFDPELGRPAEENRPSDRTQAHNVPRTWESAKTQTLRFLDAADPGVAVAPCGEDPCTAENAD